MKALKKIKTKLEIELPTTSQAKIIFKATKPEINDSPSERAKTKIKRQKNLLEIIITAQDTHSLRASMNSYLRWIMLSQQILELNIRTLNRK
jgi:KEOPS complex subunit Pcc1